MTPQSVQTIPCKVVLAGTFCCAVRAVVVFVQKVGGVVVREDAPMPAVIR